MDAGQVFVLILTAFAVGILIYVEMKSRRSRNQSADMTPSIEESSSDKKSQS
jgi:hypothetical protein